VLRAHRARPLVPRLHVDGRQPGPRESSGSRDASARLQDHAKCVSYVQLGGGGTRIDASSGALEVRERADRTTTGLSSVDHTSGGARATSSSTVRGIQSGFGIADQWGTAIGVVPRTAAILSECEQYDPAARKVEEGRVGYNDRLTRVLPRTAARHHEGARRPLRLVHRANEDFHMARDELRRRRRVDPDSGHLARWRAGRDGRCDRCASGASARRRRA